MTAPNSEFVSVVTISLAVSTLIAIILLFVMILLMIRFIYSELSATRSAALLICFIVSFKEEIMVCIACLRVTKSPSNVTSVCIFRFPTDGIYD